MKRSSEQQLWHELDAEIVGWWDADTHRAGEDEIRSDRSPGLLFLPFPYVTPGGAEGTFPTMFCWDTYFVNKALIAHGRLDLVRQHIMDYLSMIERVGFMPNTNHAAGMTRSQTPVFPESIWSYYLASGDRGVLHRAYPLLEAEYNDYWNAEHHRTPIGLATNRDLGDSNLPPAYAAEAETLDWTPIFGGDVRRCVPLMTNCALVRYARTVASIAAELGDDANADAYEDRARERAALINRYCWNESRGLFLEYDFVADEQLAYLSLCAYWPLWAGVASPHQAQRLVENLSLFERPNGLSSTDKAYDDPHESPLREEYDLSAFEVIAGGGEPLQWMYPAGWAPEHLIVVDGLWAYGYESEAQRVAERFLGLMLEQHRLTGRLWEKYNVADGTLELPNSRCGNIPMRGWTAAAVVLLGRRLWVGPY